MNKADLVDHVADKTKLPKNEIEAILAQVLVVIQEAVKAGDDVTLSGFGSFSAAKRKAHEGFNPHTGKKQTVPEMLVPRFKAGKDFKKLLNP